MTLKNKYYKSSHISEAKFREIIKCFSLDLTASDIARLTGVNRNTVNTIITRIRIRLAHICELDSPFSGEVEVDESYFGARRIRGKRGRGASGKTIVFGILKREGNVYTEIVPNASKNVLQQVIRGKVDLTTVIHSDGWRGYHGLVDVGYEKHLRAHHSQNEFARGNSHINGIESFWAYAKGRLVKFKGIPPEKFYLHLKETEYRFNHRNQNLYAILLKELRNNPL